MLADLIAEACTYADHTPIACALCGHDSDPGLTTPDGRYCQPCAHARPRLAMRLTRNGPVVQAVHVGDWLLGTIASHPSRTWHSFVAAVDGLPGGYRHTLDDALDALGECWA